MKTKIIIGIDPDVKKSGVAINDKSTGIVSASSFCFPELLDFLKDVSTRFDAIIYVEASWLIKKSNFHGGNTRVSSLIAKHVGRNHQTGILIAEMCKHYGLNVVEIEPLAKCWKGKDKKITLDELKRFAKVELPKKYLKAELQEMLDAALIAYVYGE